MREFILKFDFLNTLILSTQKEFDLGLELAGLNSVVWDDVVRNLIVFNQPDLVKFYCNEAFLNGVNVAKTKSIAQNNEAQSGFGSLFTTTAQENHWVYLKRISN